MKKRLITKYTYSSQETYQKNKNKSNYEQNGVNFKGVETLLMIKTKKAGKDNSKLIER